MIVPDMAVSMPLFVAVGGIVMYFVAKFLPRHLRSWTGTLTALWLIAAFCLMFSVILPHTSDSRISFVGITGGLLVTGLGAVAAIAIPACRSCWELFVTQLVIESLAVDKPDVNPDTSTPMDNSKSPTLVLNFRTYLLAFCIGIPRCAKAPLGILGLYPVVRVLCHAALARVRASN